MNTSSKEPWWVRDANKIYLFIISAGFIIAFGIIAIQCIHWLQEGFWNAVPLLTLFSSADFVTNYYSWYNSPDTWVGVNKMIKWILEEIPLSIAVIAFAYFIKSCWHASVLDYKEKQNENH